MWHTIYFYCQIKKDQRHDCNRNGPEINIAYYSVPHLHWWPTNTPANHCGVICYMLPHYHEQMYAKPNQLICGIHVQFLLYRLSFKLSQLVHQLSNKRIIKK